MHLSCSLQHQAAQGWPSILPTILSTASLLCHSRRRPLKMCRFDSGLVRWQPRRHAVDEGWDGDGYPDEGAPEGWAYEEPHLDALERAQRSAQRAHQNVADQRTRVERVSQGRKGFRGLCIVRFCLRQGSHQSPTSISAAYRVHLAVGSWHPQVQAGSSSATAPEMEFTYCFG